METATRLLAQKSGGDEIRQHLRRLELLVPESLVENDHDPETDVEADEVGELERTHRVVEADLRSSVDVLGRADALGEGPHRLGQERHQHPVDEKARPVGRHDDLLAEVGRQGPHGVCRRIRGRRSAHELNEGHDRHRTEEVHTDEEWSSLGIDCLREPIDRDRARVRRENGGRRGNDIDLRPEGAFDGQVLEDRLDDEPSRRRGRLLIGCPDPAKRGVALLRPEATLVDRSREVRRDALAARLRPRKVRLVEGDVAAGRREDLGDAVAHQPGACHEDRLDRHLVRAYRVTTVSGTASARLRTMSRPLASAARAAETRNVGP